MANPLNRNEGRELAQGIRSFSYETIRFNFYENAPVQKKIFQLFPDTISIAISHITYTLGSLDLSANGYIQLVISRVDNPNVYSVLQNNSQILLDVMGGANSFINDQFNFKDLYYLNKGEYLYGYLYSNIPGDIVGKCSIYYLPLFE